MRRERENCGKTWDLSKIWYMPDPWFKHPKAWDRLLQSPPVSQKQPFQKVAYQRLTEEKAPYCNPGPSVAVGPSSLHPFTLCSLTAAADFGGREYSHTQTAMRLLWRPKKGCAPFWLSAGVDCLVLHQGIFPTQGLNPRLLYLLHSQAGSLPQVPPGKTLTEKSTH